MTLRFGRYRPLRSLPPHGELQRIEAEDTETGDRVELISPDALALLRPGARERFLRTHRPLPDSPFVLGRFLGEEDGRPWALRAPVEPLPATLRLDPAAVAALLDAWAAPLAQDAALLGPDLDEQDVGLDADGHIVLAPAGLVRRDSAVKAAPHLPPEANPSPAAALLYGLGRLLFRWLTGVEPADPTSPDTLRASQGRPKRAAALRPDTPADLDQALAALLSADPRDRRPRGPARPAAVTAPRSDAPPPATLPAPAFALDGAPRARLDAALPDQALIAWPHRHPPAIQRRLAALSGHSAVAIAALAAQSLPLPLATGRADERLDPAAYTLSLAAIEARPTTPSARPYALAAVGLALGGLLLSSALFLGLLPIALGGLALALLSLGALGLHLILRPPALGPQLQAAQALLARPPAPRHPALAARAMALRRRLLDPALPDPIRVDLLDSLDPIEEAIEALPADARRADQRPIEAALDALESPLQAATPNLDLAALRQRAALAASALRG